MGRSPRRGWGGPRTRTSRRFDLFVLMMFVALAAGWALHGLATRTAADDGPRGWDEDAYPSAHAIRGAKVVAAPGRIFDPGTIVTRRGTIEAVGPEKEVKIPYDAETIDGKGLVVYPGFIDLYTTVGQPAGVARSRTGRGRRVDVAEAPLVATRPDNRRGLTPEFEVADVIELNDALAAPRRRLGFTDMVSAPAGAIVTGQSALVALSGRPRREAVVSAPLALHVNLAAPFEPPAANGGPLPGPSSSRRRGFFAPDGPIDNPYPRSLMGVVAHLRQAMLDARHLEELEAFSRKHGGARPPFDPALQALARARSRTLPLWWEANTREEIHRALDLAREFGTTAVIVGGREAAKVAQRLKAEHAPVVLRLNVPEEPKVPSDRERRAAPIEERALPRRALAHRHDQWKEQLATAAALARAGALFAFATDGTERLEDVPANLRKIVGAGLNADAALAALTRDAAAIAHADKRLGTLEPGKLAHVVAMTGPFTDKKSRVKFTLIDGLKLDVPPRRSAQSEGPRPQKPQQEPESLASKSDKPKPEPGPKSKPDKPRQEVKPRDAAFAPNENVETEFDEDRKPGLHTGGDVLIEDATILTVTKGTIGRGSILVEKGKIRAVGPDLEAPEGTTVIEARGLVAMPGMIDSHSHIAISGGVNEATLSVVPEVRVRDVVRGDDARIYRALAGGTTTARLLHGSANTIGGQDAVVKLRYGLPGRNLIVRDAPRGVKFALGENVVRSRGRFPNTRMGVQSVLRRSFEAGRAYRAAWDAYRRESRKGNPGEGKSGGGVGGKTRRPVPPPRTDLRLEALASILDGSVRIHSHCYRADEMLMLLGTAQEYGVRVRSLQHALEGYKIAPEIAAHGASVSTFSDWWAYKIEAYDAIPFNAALLTEAGVVTCLKSDDPEMMRHLNLEAAKMVKYGGVSEEQALAMVTINPARQLGLEDRLGSIEPGKDADIVLFNAHPLDAFARCEWALIDGEVYFERRDADGRHEGRPGRHESMPVAPGELRERVVEFTAQPKRTFALVGANLHPVAGADVPGGTLVIAGGKIAALGSAGTVPVPPEAQTIEMNGLDVWPGMIDAGSTLGLSEIGSLTETHDYADAARYQPELRAGVALRADSEHIPVTRANGILTAYVRPSGGAISGQGCVIDLNGWVPRDLIVADPAALDVNVPRHAPRAPSARRRGGAPGERSENERSREQLETIERMFRQALAYDAVLKAARDQGDPPPPPEPRLSALAPYARGEKLVIFHADRQLEILDAIELARKLKLKAAISGAGEAWKVTDALKTSGVPVLFGGTLRLPGDENDPYDSIYAAPAALHRAGIRFAIRCDTGGSAMPVRNLPFEAAAAVAFGLPEKTAIEAVTIAPARILGIDGQVGSLEPGKRANLVVTAGHLLQPTTPVLALFIDGEPLKPESRHTRFRDQYRRRLQDVRDGRASLGLEPPSKSRTGPVGRR